MMILQQGSKAPTHVPTTQTDHCATAVGRVFPFSVWILLTGYTCPSRLSIERERERKRCSLHLYRFTQFPSFSFLPFFYSLYTLDTTLFSSMVKKPVSRRIVIVGDGACGKTCLLLVYTGNGFPSTQVTISIPMGYPAYSEYQLTRKINPVHTYYL